MKFSEQWLREWVNPEISTDELVVQLTNAGLEVDAAEPVAAALEGVVVGEVLAVAPHPDAERLRLCQVRAAPDAEPVDVVCGAPNVVAGMKAPFAAVGARLPGGLKIRRSKIRGVYSNGMLCSVQELGLGDDADGIMRLDTNAPLGAPLFDYLQLADTIIEIDLTPNRGDCLSIAGVAREVGVGNGLAVNAPAFEFPPAQVDATFPVELQAPADCPRYAGRVIRGIDPTVATPLWMREKLRRSGVRSISPVVDVTNYVMLELGQPMHAFDLAELAGGIQVRRAAPGEKLTLLDGAELALDADSLVIADHERCVALAGIMGGQRSGVGDETRDIFLESAWFAPQAVAVEARRHGLHTDASHRFERGASIDTQALAVERATGLLLDIVGGQPGPTVDTVDTAAMPQRPTVRRRASRLQRLLGMAVPADRVEDVLGRLGMAVTALDDGAWDVTAPAFRSDITIEADLVEEIARIIGFDAIPEHLPQMELGMIERPEDRVELRALRDVLVQRGYQEAITYSFVDPAMQKAVEPDVEALALANPISADLAVMRTSLWPGLLGALVHNVNRQQGRVRLCESGLVFRTGVDGLAQTRMIGAVATGPVVSEQWGEAARDVDFFDVKGDVEALLTVAGASGAFTFEPAVHPALHPGQCARVLREGNPVGWIGALHPRIGAGWRVRSMVLAFELELASLEAGHLPKFEALSKYPAVRRDIAVVVDQAVSAASVHKAVGQAGIDVLQNLELFDVYAGEGIDSGKKSLAVGLTFQSASRTLTEHEIEAYIATIVHSLATHLGGELRG